MTALELNRDLNGRFKPGTHWRPHKVFRELDYLMREYTDRGCSAAEIAAKHGVTEGAILHWLARHNIQRRSISGARARKHWGASGSANPMFGKTGAANPRYVDGSSPERQRSYATSEAKAFIRSVFARDGYMCRRCGSGKKGPRGLHAHHIKPWAGNETLRFDKDNAVTLCRSCHEWVHSKKNMKREYLA
jgi:hypothetical protein